MVMLFKINTILILLSILNVSYGSLIRHRDPKYENLMYPTTGGRTYHILRCDNFKALSMPFFFSSNDDDAYHLCLTHNRLLSELKNEVTGMEDKGKKYDGMKEEIAQLKNTISSLSNELNKANIKYELCNKRKEEYNNIITKNEDYITINQKCESDRSKCYSLLKTCNDLRVSSDKDRNEELESCHDRNDMYNGELKLCRQELLDYTEGNEDLKELITNMEAGIGDIHIKNCKAKLGRCKDKVIKTEDKLIEKDNRCLADVRATEKLGENAINIALKDLSDVRSIHAKQTLVLDDAQNKISKLSLQVNDLNAKVEKAESEIKDKERHISVLKDNVKELTTLLEEEESFISTLFSSFW